MKYSPRGPGEQPNKLLTSDERGLTIKSPLFGALTVWICYREFRDRIDRSPLKGPWPHGLTFFGAADRVARTGAAATGQPQQRCRRTQPR